MSVYDELLVGAVDLHCHVDFELGYEHFRKIEPEWDWLPQAGAMGMRGVVLKSHWWPTAADVYYLRRLYEGPVRVVPSVTLNHVVGGPAPWVVESAAAAGCEVVFLPTWSSASDLERQGMSRRIAQVLPSLRLDGITGVSFAQEGRLTEPAHELLRLCHELGLVLATGHIAWQETMLFADEARDIGFERLLFNHPLSRSVNAPLEAVKRAAERGCWVELPWTTVAPGRRSGAAVAEWARTVGLSRIVTSTDYFRPSSPPPPLLLRSFLAELLDAGLAAHEIRQLAAANPARLLGWD